MTFPTSEIELLNPPQDTISSVAFGTHDSTSLLVSSWDSHVRLYDAAANRLLFTYAHSAAVLAAAFAAPNVAVSGGLDRIVKSVDLHSGHETVLGSHEDAVKCIATDPQTNLIASGSWDKSVKLFDLRAEQHQVAALSHPHKVHSLDAKEGKLVVATADRRFYIYDLRNLESPLLEERTGSLKFMTRCVSLMPNGEGYATSSIEGRVSVEFFDNSETSQARKYAFKCHREKQPEGMEMVYSVNALAYHPIHGTFVSGGSDGVVNLWDGFNKKRLRQYPRYATGISALCFNRDGNMLAVGCSYNFEEGELQNKPEDSVFIRPMGENETRPKEIKKA
ncbi:mitotic spindle checkpoint protein Bub3 [Podochytrium sp. JEL0797]|nr:mitotic spindle checkpoint protein Bub3 [Podochytrium sp. JEL0797]